MITKTRGIVLYRTKYSDSSLIVKILTRDFGVLSFLAKGIRSSSKKNAQVLQPGSILLLDFNYKEAASLQKLTVFNVHYTSASESPAKNMLMLFTTEVVLRTVREREADESLFEFVEASFITLGQTQNTVLINNFHLLFLSGLSKFLGIFPRLNYQEGYFFNISESRFEPGKNTKEQNIGAAVFKILVSTIDEDVVIHSGKNTRKELLHLLLKYYRVHLEEMGNIKSLEVLEAIGE